MAPVGALAHERVRGGLERLVSRFSIGVVKRSVPVAAGSVVLGLAVASVPFVLL